MAPGEIVNIVNPTDEDFQHRYLETKVTIKANTNTFVPWEWMVYWLGNPDVRDIDHRRRYRTEEVKRLRTLYGAYYDDEKWAANRPQIQAFTSDGERITTVVDDPEGTQVPTNPSAPVDQTSLLMNQISQQQAQMKAMQKQLEILQRGNAATQVDVATDDRPGTPPSNSTPIGAEVDEEGFAGLIPVGGQATVIGDPAPPLADPGPQPSSNLADQLLGTPTEVPAASSSEVEEDTPTKVRTS